MSITSSPVLGASASSAGDDFHELWALQKVLQLLNPRDGLVRVVVEGVPADEAHAQLGERSQAADITEVWQSGDQETTTYEQLKYSVANPDSPWTWSRLFQRRTASRADTCVIVKLAKLYAGVDGPRRMRMVTNQPLSEEVSTAIPLFITQLRAGRDAESEHLERLSKETGLEDDMLAGFLESFDLTGFGSASRLRLETELLLTLGQMTDANARDDLREFHSRIAALILPENRRNATVDRETVLAWLGAGAETALYPAPSNFSQPEHWIERGTTFDLVRQMLATTAIVRLSAEGGCGKTAFMTKLKGYLPLGSEVVLFDCYGGGLFLSSEDRRHLPSHALAQVANELAGLVGSPFVLQPSPSPSLTAMFMRRVRAASEVLKLRHPDAVLAIVFDAADNARIAANRHNEACFLDELTAATSWPANTRVIFTCRPGRASTLGPDKAFSDFTLQPFNPSETRQYVQVVQPTWPDSVATELHDLTGGVARRLVYAVEDIGSDRPQDAIGRLMPKSPGIDPLFLHRVKEAGDRIGDDEAVRRLLCALAHLPRPMPTWALAQVSDLEEGDVQGLANDLGGLLYTSAGWSFHDEDFEAFAGELTQSLSAIVLDKACLVLEARQSTDAYAAHSLAEAYLAAGQTVALFALAHSDPASAGVADEGERRALQMRRLILALRAAGQASDARQAQALLLTASKAIRTSRLLVQTIVRNLDLSAGFSTDQAFQQIAMRPERRSRRGELRLHLAIAAADSEPSEARNHLRWWQAWAEDALANPSTTTGQLTTRHLKLEFEVYRRLTGVPAAVDHLISRWKPKWRLLEVADALVTDALGNGRVSDVDTVLGLRRWPRVFIFNATAQLLEHGSLVDAAVLKSSLRGILQSIGPSKLGVGKAIERPVAERALVVLEASGQLDNLVPDALSVLDRCWPIDSLVKLRPGSWASERGDIIARVLALRENLTSELSDFSVLLPQPKTITLLKALRPNEKPSPSRIKIEKQNKVAEEFNAKRQSDLSHLEHFVPLARRRLVDPTSSALDKVLAPSARADNNERELPSDKAFAELHARDIARNASGPNDQLGQWILSGSLPAIRLKRLIHIVGRTGRAENFVDELVNIQATIQSDAVPASSKVELMIDGARLALRFDRDLAQSYFNAALQVADGLDIEAIEYLLAAALASGHALAGSIDDRRTVAGRLALLGEAVYEALGEEVATYMPWSEIVAGSASQHFPTALAFVGRWRDDGYVDLDIGLQALVESESFAQLPQVYQRTFQSWVGYTDVPNDPSVEDVEAFSRAAVLTDRFETLQDKAQHIGDLSIEVREGQWASALLQAADMAPQPRSQRTDAPTAVKTCVRTRAELNKRLEDLAALPYLSEYALHEVANDIASPTLRLPFLQALAQSKGDRSGLAPFLADILPSWRTYPTVAQWIASDLPELIARDVRQTTGLSYRDPRVLLELLALLPSDARKLAVVLQTVELHGDLLAPEILITLAGVIAQTAPEPDRLALVANLLDHTAKAVGQAPVVAIAIAPDDLHLSVSRWLFAMMADVDKRMRWRAAHAARHLLLYGDPAFAAAFVQLLKQSAEPVFANPDLIFYELAARNWVAVVLQRVAHDAPDRLQPHASEIGDAALAEPAHILIRALLKDAALNLECKLPGGCSPETIIALRGLNVPRTSRDPDRRQYPQRQNNRRDDASVRYQFDDADTRPYWFSPAARMFDLDIHTFEDMAERWICDKWKVPINAWKWVDEPRQSRFHHIESSMTSHRHGSEPTVERFSRYLEWHAMCCVLGELVDSREATISPYADTVDEWIAERSPTDPNFWISDLLGPPPPEERFWTLDADWNDTDSLWLEGLSEELVLQEPKSGDEFVVSASFVRAKQRSERVSINSAFVTTETALSLGAALEAVRDPMDFRIPDADDLDPIDEPGFKLEGWLIENQREARLDESDPERRSVNGVPIFPADSVISSLGLSFDPLRRAWLDSDGQVALALDIWDRAGDDEGDFSGWRLRATPGTVADLLQTRAMSLIVEVAVTRRLSGDYDPKRRRQMWKMFVVHSDLTVRSPDSHAVRLGRYWVRKLGLDLTVDTYARWLIHQIITLDAARTSLSEKDRIASETEMNRLSDRLERLRTAPYT